MSADVPRLDLALSEAGAMGSASKRGAPSASRSPSRAVRAPVPAALAFSAAETLQRERERRGPTPRRGADADVDSCGPRGPLRKGDGAISSALQRTLLY